MSRQDDPAYETCQDQGMEWLRNQLIIMNFSKPDGAACGEADSGLRFIRCGSG